MASINQQDLNVRLQLAGCKFSDLAQRFNKDLLYGRKCVTENRTDLMLLNVYLEMLECYNVNITEVLSQGSFQITSLTIGYTLEISINNVVLIPEYTSPTNNKNATMSLMVTYINTNQSVYTAVLNTENDLYKVELYGPCTGGDITYITDGNKGEIELEITDLINGVCGSESNNCLTEDQMNTIFDSISKLTKICFQPLGYTYTE